MAKATNRASWLNLFKEFRHSYYYGMVATYNFDPHFFEEHLLKKTGAFSNCRNLTVLMDEGEYKEIMEIDGSGISDLNRRYFLMPAEATKRFHPKVYLFTQPKAGFLAIGSFNLTRAGFTRNAEMAFTARYEVDSGGEEILPLFQQVFNFFSELNNRHSSRVLSENLERMYGETPWLSDEIESDGSVRFVHNLEKSIISQFALGKVMDREGFPVKEAHFISPFFDKSPELLTRLSSETGAESLNIYSQNGTTTLKKEWLVSPQAEKCNASFWFVDFEDDEKKQTLHAKAAVLVGSEKFSILWGSANCTTNGLFSTIDTGNLEAGLILTGPKGKGFKAADFFRPSGCPPITAMSPEKLVERADTGSDQPKESSNYEWVIKEAEVKGERIVLTLDPGPELTAVNDIDLAVISSGESIGLFPLEMVGGEYHASISEGKAINWINSRPCIVCLTEEDGGESRTVSNSVFVINLVDYDTGKNLREERRYRDARISHKNFGSVLSDLSGESGSEEELVRFLNLCNIEVQNVFTPNLGGRKPGGFTPGAGELRDLGIRRVRYFSNIHDAAIGFVDRHIRRLEQHVESGIVSGFPNFMHIFLSTGAVITEQLSSLVAGLDTMDIYLPSKDWYEIRIKANSYCKKQKTMLEIFSDEYVSNFKRASDIRKLRLLADDLKEDFTDYYLHTVSILEKFGETIDSGFQTKNDYGEILPPYAKEESFAPLKLPRYLEQLGRLVAQVENVLGW